MGCGCKNKNKETSETVKTNNTQTVKEAITKTVEKYYENKK